MCETKVFYFFESVVTAMKIGPFITSPSSYPLKPLCGTMVAV